MEQDSVSINELICNLASSDDSTRIKARQSLVTMGRRVVPYLIKALGDKYDSTRAEAVKALAEIGGEESAPGLVKALQDEEFGIRWAAAEGLIAMNARSLKALFQALEEKPDSSLLREGAHHVIHGLARGELRKYLAPVLVALEGPAPMPQTLMAVHRAMEDMEKAKIPVLGGTDFTHRH